jgi:hypothetical protein
MLSRLKEMILSNKKHNRAVEEGHN